MKSSYHYDGIRMDVQTVGIEMNDFLQQQITRMVRKLRGLLPEVNWIDIYIKNSVGQSVAPRQVSVRFGIPGPDIVASDRGKSWKSLLKNVERKLIRQWNKRKTIKRNFK